MPRLHRRDHVVHRAALERMHGRGPGVVEVAELRVVAAELQLPPVLQNERHPPVPDLGNLGVPAVDEPEPGVVARPADTVTGA